MLIGLCGAAGCGKNTVADILCDRHNFMQLAFADAIYRAVGAVTGVPVETLRDRAVKDSPLPGVGVSPRRLLQTLGTEWGRKMIANDIWIRKTLRDVERLEACVKCETGIVITDVRFDNEASAIKARGGTIWKVVRGGGSCLSTDAAAHESEGGVTADLIDLAVLNNGTLEELFGAVDRAMRDATGGYNNKTRCMERAGDRRDETVHR